MHTTLGPKGLLYEVGQDINFFAWVTKSPIGVGCGARLNKTEAAALGSDAAKLSRIESLLLLLLATLTFA